jgi:hypothetical protein
MSKDPKNGGSFHIPLVDLQTRRIQLIQLTSASFAGSTVDASTDTTGVRSGSLQAGDAGSSPRVDPYEASNVAICCAILI